MMNRRFGGRSALVAVLAACFAAPVAMAQQAEPAPKPGKLISAGDVLSGELTAVRSRGAGRCNRGHQSKTFAESSHHHVDHFRL